MVLLFFRIQVRASGRNSRAGGPLVLTSGGRGGCRNSRTGRVLEATQKLWVCGGTLNCGAWWYELEAVVSIIPRGPCLVPELPVLQPLRLLRVSNAPTGTRIQPLDLTTETYWRAGWLSLAIILVIEWRGRTANRDGGKETGKISCRHSSCHHNPAPPPFFFLFGSPPPSESLATPAASSIPCRQHLPFGSPYCIRNSESMTTCIIKTLQRARMARYRLSIFAGSCLDRDGFGIPSQHMSTIVRKLRHSRSSEISNHHPQSPSRTTNTWSRRQHLF